MRVLVVGAGAVGKALFSVIKEHHKAKLIDKVSLVGGSFDVMHICFPYGLDFIEEVTKYIVRFNPGLTIIESTVPVGTTREIWLSLNQLHDIVHSPVRGSHDELVEGIRFYDKCIGAFDTDTLIRAYRYYEDMGLYPRMFCGPEETEFSKLANLSYFAVQIAFFQEIERKAKKLGVELFDVHHFFKSAGRDRPVRTGGVIGGSCVMQGMKKLFGQDQIYNWVNCSNEARKQEV